VLTSIRLVGASVGALLLSWAILLSEDEERTVQSVLETWWVRLDDLDHATATRAIAIVNRFSVAIAAWLDSVFGQRLLSFHACAASFCLSLSGFLVMSIVGLWPKNEMSWRVLAIVVAVATASFFVGVSSRLNYSKYFITTLIVLSVGGMIGLHDRYGLSVETYQVGKMLAFAFSVGVLADFLVVALVRYLARRGTSAHGLIWPIVASTICAAVAVAIFVYPVFLMHSWDTNRFCATSIAAFGLTNLYAAVIASSFILLAICMVLQRLFWPILKRPVYAMQRFRIFEQRKLLFFAGATLIGIATPSVVDVLESVKRFFF